MVVTGCDRVRSRDMAMDELYELLTTIRRKVRRGVAEQDPQRALELLNQAMAGAERLADELYLLVQGAEEKTGKEQCVG